MNFSWTITALVLFFLLVINALYVNTMKNKPYKSPAKGFAIFTMITGLLTFMFAVYEASQSSATSSYAGRYL